MTSLVLLELGGVVASTRDLTRCGRLGRREDTPGFGCAPVEQSHEPNGCNTRFGEMYPLTQRVARAQHRNKADANAWITATSNARRASRMLAEKVALWSSSLPVRAASPCRH